MRPAQPLSADRRQLTPQQRLWYRRFCHENRVPLLLWQEMHHNLSGIVYAETLDKHRQAFDSARGHNSPACSGGLQLTWLYALASHWGKQRFALQRFSLGRDALTLHVGSARVCRRYVLPLRDTRLPEGEAGRYLRLFMRDNRHWLQAWQNGDRRNGWTKSKTTDMPAKLPPMKFYEIAQRYFPHPRNSAATQQLRRWIQADPQLRKALKAAGVRRGQHVYSPRQQRVFEKWLG